MENTGRVIRPNEEPFSWKAPKEWGEGSWLKKQLEYAGFGKKVDVRVTNLFLHSFCLFERFNSSGTLFFYMPQLPWDIMLSLIS